VILLIDDGGQVLIKTCFDKNLLFDVKSIRSEKMQSREKHGGRRGERGGLLKKPGRWRVGLFKKRGKREKEEADY
jgi:hypothetical protein